MTGMLIARRFLIAGRVQGVFFRASTRAQAERLGLAGQAINLSDGRVEVVAVGPEARITELEEWLEQGPAAARVDSVVAEPLETAVYSELSDFRCG